MRKIFIGTLTILLVLIAAVPTNAQVGDTGYQSYTWEGFDLSVWNPYTVGEQSGFSESVGCNAVFMPANAPYGGWQNDSNNRNNPYHCDDAYVYTGLAGINVKFFSIRTLRSRFQPFTVSVALRNAVTGVYNTFHYNEPTYADDLGRPACIIGLYSATFIPMYTDRVEFKIHNSHTAPIASDLCTEQLLDYQEVRVTGVTITYEIPPTPTPPPTATRTPTPIPSATSIPPSLTPANTLTPTRPPNTIAPPTMLPTLNTCNRGNLATPCGTAAIWPTLILPTLHLPTPTRIAVLPTATARIITAAPTAGPTRSPTSIFPPLGTPAGQVVGGDGQTSGLSDAGSRFAATFQALSNRKIVVSGTPQGVLEIARNLGGGVGQLGAVANAVATTDFNGGVGVVTLLILLVIIAVTTEIVVFFVPIIRYIIDLIWKIIIAVLEVIPL